MGNRHQRRAYLKNLGADGRAQLELLKQIDTEDPEKLEAYARDFEARGLTVAAQGVRNAITHFAATKRSNS